MSGPQAAAGRQGPARPASTTVERAAAREPVSGDGGVAAGARPAQICQELLAALEASEGRSRRRKRDQRPDAIGLGIKRALLEAAVAEDPEPDAFEGWLLERCLRAGPGSGAMRAMALSIFDEWRLVQAAPSFRSWLGGGAPSDDRIRERNAAGGAA